MHSGSPGAGFGAGLSAARIDARPGLAIGVAGIPAVVDYRGTTDTYGNTLDVTEVALADELAAAADLVMGKAKGIPAALIRGAEYPPGEGSSADLVRSPTQDMFR